MVAAAIDAGRTLTINHIYIMKDTDLIKARIEQHKLNIAMYRSEGDDANAELETLLMEGEEDLLIN